MTNVSPRSLIQVPMDRQQRSTSKCHHSQNLHNVSSYGIERRTVSEVEASIHSRGLLDRRLARQTCEDGGDGVSLLHRCTLERKSCIIDSLSSLLRLEPGMKGHSDGTGFVQTLLYVW